MTETDKRLMKKMLKTMEELIDTESWYQLNILSVRLATKAGYLEMDK